MAVKIKLKRITADPTLGSQMSALEDGEVVINPTSGGIFYKYNNGGGDSIAEPAALHRPAAFQSTLSAVGEMNSLGNFLVGPSGNILTVNSSTGVSTFGGPINQSGGAVNFGGDVTFTGSVTLPTGGATISTFDDFFAAKNVDLGSTDSDILTVNSTANFLGPVNLGSANLSSTGVITLGSVANSVTIVGNFFVNGNTTLGNANSDSTTINGNVTIGTDQTNIINVNGDITLGTGPSNDTVTVDAVTSFNGGVVVTDGFPFTANGNVNLGNAAGDSIVFNGTPTFNTAVNLINGVSSNVVPTNTTFELGSSSTAWQTLYSSNIQTNSANVNLYSNGSVSSIIIGSANGNTRIRSGFTVDSDTVIDGSLSVAGNLTFDAQTFVDARKFTIRNSAGAVVVGLWGLDTDTINN